jgi:hypothetical protein
MAAHSLARRARRPPSEPLKLLSSPVHARERLGERQPAVSLSDCGDVGCHAVAVWAEALWAHPGKVVVQEGGLWFCCCWSNMTQVLRQRCPLHGLVV